MRSAAYIAPIFAAAALAGCAGNPSTGTGPRENTGTLMGAVAGAAVGSQIGGSTGSRIAAGVAGAAIGGLIGNRIGAALDDEDRERAYEAQLAALESARPGLRPPGAIPIPDAMVRSCLARNTTAVATNAAIIPIRSISMAGRKPRVGRPAAILMALGRPSANADLDASRLTPIETPVR